MTATQFLARVGKKPPAAVLLLGPESYGRGRIKSALMEAFPAGGAASHDLAEVPLAEALDDARSLSLFASDRLIWLLNADAALPRTRGAADEDAGAAGGSEALAAYLRDPTPGVTLVFEAERYGFEGDDKRKQDRVRKFYEGVQDVVELRRRSIPEARAEAAVLAKAAGLRIGGAALDALVEALGADLARLAVEIEKLALYAGSRELSEDDVAALAPEARSATVFALVDALGRRDRDRALRILDTLTREGEYLPLALAFLSTQFRMALAAREAGLKSAQQIQGHFSRMGTAMWGSRAEQVYQTAAAFRPPQLARALKLIFEADRGLRDARPDDRVVMERLILQMTA